MFTTALPWLQVATLSLPPYMPQEPRSLRNPSRPHTVAQVAWQPIKYLTIWGMVIRKRKVVGFGLFMHLLYDYFVNIKHRPKHHSTLLAASQLLIQAKDYSCTVIVFNSSRLQNCSVFQVR